MNLGKGISVIVHTFNEERNIRNCLESVKWADEIVIIDMYSEDKTVEIAREYTDKIYFFEREGYADPARQFGVEQATRNWVLVVDADEMVPQRLSQRLREIVEKDEADVVYIPRKNYFFGKLLEGGGWGPLQAMIPRFFKKGFLRLSDRVHDVIDDISSEARILMLRDRDMAVVHFNYVDIDHFLEKGINKYTSIEALNMINGRKSKVDFASSLLMAFKEFINRMLFHKGYKDDLIGFYLSTMMAIYRLNSYAKLRLMEKFDTCEVKEKILDIYSKIAREILNEYG